MSNKHLVAVLMDGGFISRHVKKALRPTGYPEAQHFLALAKACINPVDEELFRIYFYDSPPFGEKTQHPLTKEQVTFKNRYYDYRMQLLKQLAESDNVALRKGDLNFVGWRLTKKAVKAFIEGRKTQLAPDDVEPDFRQKCVDMMIGLDVAWLSNKSIVEKIVLIANDRDFVPPMKHARREGVRIVIVEWPGQYRVLSELRIHADEVRRLPEGTACLGMTTAPAPDR